MVDVSTPSVACLHARSSSEWLAKSKAQAMLPRLFEITDLQWETGAGDVFTWHLSPCDGMPMSYQPGQFNMVYGHGLGEVPISISSDCEQGSLIHTLRAVGSVTQGLQKLRIGDRVGLRGPFGSAWPVQAVKSKDVILIAGGIGLAPLRPLIYWIRNHRTDYGRVHLLYGARSPLELLYRDELDRWAREGEIEIAVTVDKAVGQWQGHIGVVTQLLADMVIQPERTVAMMCGPEVMMHFCQLGLAKLGLADSDLWVTMERNMKCAIGHCGHCEWGPSFMCKDGPVYRFDQVRDWFRVREF